MTDEKKCDFIQDSVKRPLNDRREKVRTWKPFWYLAGTIKCGVLSENDNLACEKHKAKIGSE
jgi:hypothetical protein